MVELKEAKVDAMLVPAELNGEDASDCTLQIESLPPEH